MLAVDPHRLAQERSRVLHGEIARRLGTEPSLIEDARRRVASWRLDRSVAPAWIDAWEAWLDLEPTQLAARLAEASDEACSMRQVTPFAGVISPQQRWRIWREVGAAADGAP